MLKVIRPKQIVTIFEPSKGDFPVWDGSCDSQSQVDLDPVEFPPRSIFGRLWSRESGIRVHGHLALHRCDCGVNILELCFKRFKSGGRGRRRWVVLILSCCILRHLFQHLFELLKCARPVVYRFAHSIINRVEHILGHHDKFLDCTRFRFVRFGFACCYASFYFLRHRSLAWWCPRWHCYATEL